MSESELLLRDAVLELRSETEDEWTVEGLAVPYNVPAEVGGYRESFQPGAFGDITNDVHLYFGHGHLRGEAPIGRIVSTEDTAEGLRIRAKISKTVRGTETYQLLKDGVLTKYSIGFRSLAHKIVNGVTVRTKAFLSEVSIVANPAYSGAAVSLVRDSNSSSASADDVQNNERSDMTDVNSGLDEVRSDVEDLSRKVSVLETRGGSSHEEASVASKYRSLGHFVQSLYRGEVSQNEVPEMHRALTNVANTGDAGAQRPGWVQREIKMLAEKRPVLDFFSKEPLPATGLTVTYPQFSSKSGDVAKQTNETDDLPYMEIVVNTATANVETYGAYSQLSRQVIDRQDESYVNKVLEAQRNSYAKTTNGVVRTLLGTSPASYNQATALPALSSQNTAKPWIDSALDGIQKIVNNSQGLTADAWIVSFQTFTKLIGIYDTTGRPVFALNGDGVNTVGNGSLRNFGLNVAGLPVLVDFGLTAGSGATPTESYIVSRESLTVLEDTVKSLQDVNVVNLSNIFSIYSYLAVTKNDVKGISRVQIPNQ